MAEYFRANNMTFTPVAFEKSDATVAAYDSGRCDVYTTDRSGLAAMVTKMSNPAEHVVLPEIISKEPLGPVVRQDDPQWMILRDGRQHAKNWALRHVEGMALYQSAIRRLLGVEGDLGKNIGLSNDWLICCASWELCRKL